MKISRKTGFAVVVAAVLWMGLKVWAEEHWDDCDRYVAGDRTEPDSVEVREGTRKVIEPCGVWVMRQPGWVQGWWLVVGAVGLVAVVSGVGDWRRRDKS